MQHIPFGKLIGSTFNGIADDSRKFGTRIDQVSDHRIVDKVIQNKGWSVDLFHLGLGLGIRAWEGKGLTKGLEVRRVGTLPAAIARFASGFAGRGVRV